jgi:hypothetical protein
MSLTCWTLRLALGFLLYEGGFVAVAGEWFGTGRPGYAPADLLNLYIYGYLGGVSTMTSAACLPSASTSYPTPFAPGAMSASGDSRRRSPFWKPRGSRSM